MKKWTKIAALLLATAFSLLLLTACGGGSSTDGVGPQPTGDELVDAVNNGIYSLSLGHPKISYLTCDPSLNQAAEKMFKGVKGEKDTDAAVLQRIAFSDIEPAKLLNIAGLSSSEIRIMAAYPHADAEEAALDVVLALSGLSKNGYSVSSMGSYKVHYSDNSYGYLILLRYKAN